MNDDQSGGYDRSDRQGYGRDYPGSDERGYQPAGNRHGRLDPGPSTDGRERMRRAGYGDEQRDHGDRDRYGRGDDRGFLARAGDEVRSWFGDDDDGRGTRDREGRRIGANWDGDRVHDHRDRHYHDWRENQIAQLDRDYEEYRREHQSRFENEFATWRTGRQSQRELLNAVDEHMEVTGSDGEHVGTVDKVRGDRIILTKNDQAAGGRHHSIPSSWLRSVEGGKVMLSKSSAEAKATWRDEERREPDQGMSRNDGRSAMFGGRDRDAGRPDDADDGQGRMLDRSFSGTY